MLMHQVREVMTINQEMTDESNWIWSTSDEFCIEIRRESNPRESKPRSHTVCDINHSANRVYTIGTECSHHM